MTRLTVTMDEETTNALDDFAVRDWREAVEEAMEILPVDESMGFVRLARSLRELREAPSHSAIIRQAVELYLELLHEAKRSVDLASGYRALAMDRERQEIVDVMSKRAPQRWRYED